VSFITFKKTLSGMVSLVFWAAIILLPVVVLFIAATRPLAEARMNNRIYSSLIYSVFLSVIIASTAVVSGWIPGRLLGTHRTGRDLFLFIFLLTLVLPRYLLYYAWALLFSPTTALGTYLSNRTELARLVGAISCIIVMITWYWPLAALFMAQGWRKIDRQIWDCALIDAGGYDIFRSIILPLLGRAVLLAFGVCFILSLSDFASYSLAGMRTIGTQLSVLYELTGSEAYLARAAWPVAVIALIVAVCLGTSTFLWEPASSPVGQVEFKAGKRHISVLFVLLGFSLIAPLLILVINIKDTSAFGRFYALHIDELAWSLAIAAVAAVVAFLLAFAALSLEKITGGRFASIGKLLSFIARTTMFFIMFMPASVFGVAVLKTLAAFDIPMDIRQSWYIVSVGQGGVFSGVALILFLLGKDAHEKDLSEMASLDGASQLQIFRYIYLPRTYPLFMGGFILLVMFSVTELSATMILLPAGLPNFAQRLLNQMHYVQDQHVIVSCLALMGVFVALSVCIILLFRTLRLGRWMLVILSCLFVFAGCNDKSASSSYNPAIITIFGRTGEGQCEFIYPRPIDITKDGLLFVVDKTGRIQKLKPDGKYLDSFKMPLTEQGKPTGITVGPDGNLYVADTHYSRVVVFSPDNKIIRQWGSFGKDNGCFIYPTDVAFSGDGKIFVSEYGGNDRISVFNMQGEFLYCFGSQGSGNGQLSRPSALCVDDSGGKLFVADACNHRIAIYSFDGKVLGYFGKVGSAAGELRYPYDLKLLDDGTIVVCEFGNNRIQLFNTEGKSLAVYGKAGRQSGQLAYPWGIAVDKQHHVYIVDAGNNRIQVWQI
jgi:ABC-type Fe3+ transport system permease subunit/DNA-binding beta-propeller fold protein YncE